MICYNLYRLIHMNRYCRKKVVDLYVVGTNLNLFELEIVRFFSKNEGIKCLLWCFFIFICYNNFSILSGVAKIQI